MRLLNVESIILVFIIFYKSISLPVLFASNRKTMNKLFRLRFYGKQIDKISEAEMAVADQEKNWSIDIILAFYFIRWIFHETESQLVNVISSLIKN